MNKIIKKIKIGKLKLIKQKKKQLESFLIAQKYPKVV